MLSIVCSEPIASKYLWGRGEGRLRKLKNLLTVCTIACQHFHVASCG